MKSRKLIICFSLKDWVAKQAEREEEREERKKKKMDKLKEEFHHEFKDPDYYKSRSEVTDKVHDAIIKGIYHIWYYYFLIINFIIFSKRN